jgi:hypothetical protein
MLLCFFITADTYSPSSKILWFHNSLDGLEYHINTYDFSQFKIMAALTVIMYMKRYP